MVPLNFDEDPDLGAWVAGQKRAYQEDRMPARRTRALKAIGFQFSSEDASGREETLLEVTGSGKKASTLKERWAEQFDKLKAFHDENGHCAVPRNFNKQLSYWLQRQRQLNLQSKLKKDRKELLDELNFDWYTGINELPEHYFDEMMQRLAEYQKEHGTVDVPTSYLRGGLGEWVQDVKYQGGAGHLSPDEAERLLRIGFAWTEGRSSWFKHFDRVSDEIEDCRRGELQLTKRAENWLKVQFMLLEYDLLLPQRVEKMEELEVEWDGEALSWKENDDANNATKNRASDDDIFSTGALFKAAAIAWTPEGKTKFATLSSVASDHSEESATETGPTPLSGKKRDDNEMDMSPLRRNKDSNKGGATTEDTSESQGGEHPPHEPHEGAKGKAEQSASVLKDEEVTATSQPKIKEPTNSEGKEPDVSVSSVPVQVQDARSDVKSSELKRPNPEVHGHKETPSLLGREPVVKKAKTEHLL
jgi:Helicase associated domain